MTGAPKRDQSMPLSVMLSQTKSALPRMFANGTPPPLPPPPHARVVAVVAVVAHHPDLARLHVERPLVSPKLAVRAVVEREVRLVLEVLDVEIPLVAAAIGCIDLRVRVDADVAVRHLPAVDPRVAVLRLELVAGERDDPLDEVLLRVLREREDHDVAAVRAASTSRAACRVHGMAGP